MKSKIKLTGILLIFIVLIFSQYNCYSQSLSISNIDDPAGANGTYLKQSGDKNGFSFWEHESGTYTVYKKQYQGGDFHYYWNIDNDYDDTDVYFYAEADGIDSPVTPAITYVALTGFGSSASGVIVTEIATGPEIDIRGNGISITNGDNTPSFPDNTKFGSANVSGETITHNFVIHNTGATSLSLTGSSPYVSISGTNATDFSVTTIPSNAIAASGSTTFVITFNPSGEGGRTATLSVANSDSDEDPYTFGIHGYGYNPKNIMASGVTNPSNANGTYTHMGTEDRFEYWKHESQNYYIHNEVYSGNQYWYLDVDIDGSDSDFKFSKLSDEASPVGLSGWSPNSPSTGTLVISLATPEPEINLLGNGVSIVDGDNTPSFDDHTIFGSVNISSGSRNRTFTIQNLGSETLTLSGSSPYVSVSSSGFSISTAPSSSIAAYSSTTFTVTFDPSTEGINSAILSINSNDSDESPFDFTVQGWGYSPKDLLVSDITTPSTANGVYTHQGIMNELEYWKHESENYYIYNEFFNGDYFWDIDNNTDPTTVYFYSDDHNRDYLPLNVNTWITSSGTGTPVINYNGPEISIEGNSTEIADGDTSPDSGDNTDFGNQNISSGSTVKIYTIKNTGGETLSLTGSSPYVSISGHTSDFTLTSIPSSSISAGSSTNFEITFNPTANGIRSATISIVNNDSDENPYNFNIQGTGTSPEINVQGNSLDIADGDTEPRIEDHTDFGNISVDAGFVERTFTIQNTGNETLTLGTDAANLSGLHSADFSISSQPATTVAPAGSTTVKVQFNPGASGLRSAELSITNNDTNENPYNFNIQGTGIDINAPSTQAHSLAYSNIHATKFTASWTRGNGGNCAVFISEGTTGSATPDDNVEYTADPEFGSGDEIVSSGWFCVYNGTGTTVIVTGLNTLDTFRVIVCEYNEDSGFIRYNTSDATNNPANQSLISVIINEVDADTPGTDNMEFIELYDGGIGNISLEGLVLVTFNGSDDLSYNLGGHSSGIDLDGYSTDANGYFVLGNTGVSGSDINFNDNSLQNGADAVALYVGDGTDFPNDTPINTTNLIDAFVYDTNDADDAGLLVLLTGGGQVNEDSNGDMVNHSSQRIPNGTGGLRNTSTYITDWPTPDAMNQRSPEIDILGNGNSIADGDSSPVSTDYTDFGNVDTLRETKTHMFWIQNTAVGDLLLTGVSPYINLSGSHSGDFEVITIPKDSIIQNDSTKFEITFNPTNTGLREATITIDNNDPDEGHYEFAVQGTGTVTPEIELSGNGLVIVNNDASPGFSDSTDFGNNDIVYDSTTVEYKIKNLGTAPLTISGADPFVVVSGTNASEFRVSDAPSTYIPAGDSTTFRITFNPTAVGLRTADLTINNNDSDEGTFTYSIQGTGFATPEIDITGNGKSIADDDTIASVTDDTDFGDVDVVIGSKTNTFTILNTGSGTLNLTDPSPYVTITGDVPDFTLSQAPSPSVAPVSGTTNFDITFNPTTTGIRSAVVSIVNDDGDENPYNFSIKGVGIDTTAPVFTCPSDRTIALDSNCNTVLPDFRDSILVVDNFDPSPVVVQSPAGGITITGEAITIVQIKATDASGNADSCTFTSTTQDTTIPLITCRGDTTVYLDGNCEYTIGDLTFHATASDNCGTANISQTLSGSSTLSGDGDSRLVTLTADDGNGNSNYCSFTITAEDTTRPSITCLGDTMVYLDDNCEYFIGDLTFHATESDNCGTAIITQSLSGDSILSGDADSRLVTLTADDGNGNINSCNFTITAEDTTSPSITCLSDTTVYLDGNCEYSIGDLRFRATASDNCGIVTISQTLSGSSTMTGDGDSRLVTLTADDSNGNINFCSFIITSLDTISPTITCQGDTIVYLEGNCVYSIGDLSFRATASDNCGTAIISQILSGLDTLSGDGDSRHVTLTADDGNGNTNSCSFNIVAEDITPPQMLCEFDTIYLDNSGIGTTISANLDAGTYDNCGINHLQLSQDQFSCTDIGTIAKVDKLWINEFHYDNESTDVGEFVEVAGTSGIDMSGYKLVFYNGSDSMVYNEVALSGIIPDEQNGFGALAFFIPGIQNGPDGIALVNGSDVIEFISYEGTFIAKDGSAVGLTSVDIGVFETSSTSVGYSLQRTGQGNSPENFTWIGPIEDSPGSLNVGQKVESFYGVEVYLIAEDINGNIDSCATLITILDTVSPEVHCKNATVYLNSNGEAEITANMLDNGSIDACGIDTMIVSRTSYNCEDLKPHEALWINELHYDNESDDINEFVEIAGTSGFDLNGFQVYLYNGSNGEFYDSLSISGIIPDEVNGYGALAFYIPDIQNGAPDGVALVEENRYVIDFISYEGQLTATNGPAIGLTADELQVNESSSTLVGYSLQKTGIGASSNDFSWCGPSDDSPGQINIGQVIDTTSSYPVTLIVEDKNGNIDNCTTTVFVLDTIPPTPICRDTFIYLDEQGAAEISVEMVNGGSYDNCEIYKIRLSQYNVSCSDLDGLSVDLIATDDSGNENICNAYVAIYDTISPVMTCNDIEIELWESGQYVLDSLEKNSLVQGTTDNCTQFDEIQFQYENFTFDCVDVFDVDSVNITAFDKYGNTSSCYSNVIVADVTKPVVECRDTVMQLDSTGNAIIFPGQLVETENTFDNCGIATIEIDTGWFSCNDIGENKIKVSVYDENGNKDWCKSTVIITDGIDPLFNDVANIEVLVESGICTTTLIDYPEIIASDNCSVNYQHIEGLGAVGEFPLGETIETWLATDAGGNSDTLSFTVNVVTYNAPPTLDQIPDLTVPEDTGIVQLILTGITSGNDCESQLIASIDAEVKDNELITSATFNYNQGDTEATLDLQFGANENGSTEIVVSIFDDGGTANGGINFISDTFTIIVEPVNDPPYLVNPIPNVISINAQRISVPLNNILMTIFDDIDEGDSLCLSSFLSGGSNLPSWIIIGSDSVIAEPSQNDYGYYDICVAATDLCGACCIDTFTLSVIGLTDVDELNNLPQIEIYPNPTTGKVKIELTGFKDENIKIIVRDIIGKEIINQEFQESENLELDLSNNTTGIYFVKVKTKEVELIRKIILRK